MNKFSRICIFLFLCVMLVAFSSQAWAGRETISNPPQQINMLSGDTPWAFRIVDGREPGGVRVFEIKPDGSTAIFASGITRHYIDGDGNVYTYDSDSNLDSYVPSDKIEYIDSITDLSSWDIALTAGESYFQTEAGKTYVVDMFKIWNSTLSGGTYDGAVPSSTSAFGLGSSNSGVSAILPLATADNIGQTVTILLAATGDRNDTGTSVCQVWAATSTGTTAWGYVSSNVQNMSGLATAGVSNVTVFSATPSLNLDDTGDSETWRLFVDSAVSAQLQNPSWITY